MLNSLDNCGLTLDAANPRIGSTPFEEWLRRLCAAGVSPGFAEV